MPQTCTVCLSPKIEAINKALIESEPLRKIAARCDTSTGALQRHKRHLPIQMEKAAENRQIEIGGTVLEQLISLHKSTLQILEQAKSSGSLETALRAIAQARGNLELLAKLEGALASGGNIVNNNGPVSIEVTYVQSGARPYNLDAAQSVLDATEAENVRLSVQNPPAIEATCEA